MTFFQYIARRIPKGRFYWREILSVFFILIAFYFFRKERAPLEYVSAIINSINISWLWYSLALTMIYILLQTILYRHNFRAVNSHINFISALELYLKRNLISIFLPARSFTSRAFFRSILQQQNISDTKARFAFYLQLIISIAALIVIIIPVVFYFLLVKGVMGQQIIYLIILAIIIIAGIFVIYSLYHKAWCYRWLIHFSPQLELILQEIFSDNIAIRQIVKSFFIALLIEIIALAQLYFAVHAIGPELPAGAVFIGYIIAAALMLISPFLKGIGAIELALVAIFVHYGYDIPAAGAITLLFRFFNFWLPVFIGFVSFLFNRGNLLLRIFPAFITFALGIINLLSGLSPAIHWRMKLIQEFLPISTIHASNDFIVAAGVVLIITATFLLRGLQSAWILALIISLLSVVAHLTKAIDYEEAILAFATVIILIATRKQYYVKSSRRLLNTGIKVALLLLLAVIAFGVIGFYFVDKKHFGVNLSFGQSLKYTLQNFILLNTDLVPKTKFASGFLRAINVMGIGSLGFLFYTCIRPFVFAANENEEDLTRAKKWAQQYGRSAAEYFKTYPDKIIFTQEGLDGFISYKTANDFAIALGEPVCAADKIIKQQFIEAFEKFCTEHGLQPAYYRVDEEILPLFTEMKKRSLLIGQEAIIDATHFSMEGKARQNLRTARNTLLKKGYSVKIISPPVPGNILQQLKTVSDDWLQKLFKEEMVFSQGMFLEEEIKQHTILIIEAPDGSIIAFLDIVPDYKPHELRYDLIRKLSTANNGCMDLLMVALIDYCKNNGFNYINMGLAPMSGIEAPKGFRERSIKFAYEKIKRFQHYRGLRNFKEKFDPVWENKYLIYNHHFDLLLLPAALNKVHQDLQD